MDEPVEVNVRVPVRIVGVHLEPSTGASVVLLGEYDEITRVLPIFIGPAEAQAIMVALAGVSLPRPGTHDLTVTLMATADVSLTEVAVTELVDGTFLAELDIDTPTGASHVSARPSDGIALALRVGAPIVVSDEVLDVASVAVNHEEDVPFSDDEIDRIVGEFHEFIEEACPADFRVEETGEDDPDARTDPSGGPAGDDSG